MVLWGEFDPNTSLGPTPLLGRLVGFGPFFRAAANDTVTKHTKM